MKSANDRGSSFESQIRRTFLAFRASGRKGSYPNRLKSLCLKAVQSGLSRKNVADLASVSRQTICQWEKALIPGSDRRVPPIDDSRFVQVLDVIKPPLSPSGSILISIGEIKIEIAARSDR